MCVVLGVFGVLLSVGLAYQLTLAGGRCVCVVLGVFGVLLSVGLAYQLILAGGRCVCVCSVCSVSFCLLDWRTS